jgi:hypothetical protein
MAALAHGTGAHMLAAPHAQGSGVAAAAAAATTTTAVAVAAAAPCDGEEARVPVDMTHATDAFSWRTLLSFVGALRRVGAAAMRFVSTRVRPKRAHRRRTWR